MMLPEVVTAIAAQTAQAQRGVVSTRYERSFHVRAGPASRSDHMILIGIYEDGDLVSIHVVEDKLGGRTANADELSQLKAQYEHPKPTDLFRAPWDPRYLTEYTYRVVDATTIVFTSQVNDTAHGSGTFTIDGHNNVLTYRYTMSANWSYVTTSEITGTRAEVLPGYWGTTQETQRYAGRYHQVPGDATTEITQSSFARFANVVDAKRAAGSS